MALTGSRDCSIDRSASGPGLARLPAERSAPTVVLSTPIVLRAHTAYRVQLGGGASSSAAGVLADFRLRKAATESEAARTLAEFYRYRTEGSAVINVDGVRYIRRTANTDFNAVLELTLQTSSGTVDHAAGPGRPRYVRVTACGEARRFPFASIVE